MKYVYPEQLYKKIYSEKFSIYGIYFKSIFFSIFSILNKIKDKKTILDFGCGEGYLKKILIKKESIHEIINYDVIRTKSEVESHDDLNYDIIVASHVFCLFTKDQLEFFLKKEIDKNPKIKFIVAIGKQNFLSKLVQFLSNKRGANSFNNLNGEEEFKIINKVKRLKFKKNIFFMTDVCYFE